MKYMCRGFTLIEMLVVVAVLAVIAAVALAGLVSFRGHSDLTAASEQAISYLSDARARTLASKSDSQYSVRFNLDRFIFFKGTAFASSSTDNVQFLLPAGVEISSIALAGGGKDVIFERITGETPQSGTVVFRLKADTSRTKTVAIKSTGVVSVQ